MGRFGSFGDLFGGGGGFVDRGAGFVDRNALGRQPFGQGLQGIFQQEGIPPLGQGDGPQDLLAILGGLNLNFATDKFAFNVGGGQGGQRRRQLDSLLEEALKNLRRNRGQNRTRRIGDGGRTDIVRTDPNQSTAGPVPLRNPLNFDPDQFRDPVTQPFLF